MNIDIKPIKKTTTFTTLSIGNVLVNLDNSADIMCSIIGDGVNEGYYLTMDAETYAGWGDDDQYVINWVMSQLGVKPA